MQARVLSAILSVKSFLSKERFNRIIDDIIDVYISEEPALDAVVPRERASIGALLRARPSLLDKFLPIDPKDNAKRVLRLLYRSKYFSLVEDLFPFVKPEWIDHNDLERVALQCLEHEITTEKLVPFVGAIGLIIRKIIEMGVFIDRDAIIEASKRKVLDRFGVEKGTGAVDFAVFAGHILRLNYVSRHYKDK